MARQTPDRPYVKVSENGCWLWVRYRSAKGYARMKKGDEVYVHRITYAAAKGPIPEGYHIDHLCRNPGCVNPAHLEAVTRVENIRRGVGPTALALRTGRCHRGHDLSLSRHPGGACRPCKTISKRLERQRKRAA